MANIFSSDISLSKNQLYKMLEILGEASSVDSLQMLQSIVKNSPELLTKEDLFQVVNYPENLTIIKQAALQKIRHSLSSLSKRIEEKSLSPFDHFWSKREVEELSIEKDLSSVAKIKKFIEGVSEVLSLTKEELELLDALKNAQQMIDRKEINKRRDRLEETIEKIVIEARALEQRFILFLSALFELMNVLQSEDMKEGLIASSVNGELFLKQVDTVIALLRENFFREDKPIGEHIGFGWGIFLAPIISSLEKAPSHNSSDYYDLYEELLQLRKAVEKEREIFAPWLNEKKIKPFV